MDPEWKVKTIMLHITKASNNYGQRLGGLPMSPLELREPETADEVIELTDLLNTIDDGLIKYVNDEDVDISYETKDGIVTHKTSTIVSQIAFHAIEHRAQIVAALDRHNIRSINLDNYDVWSFVKSR